MQFLKKAKFSQIIAIRPDPEQAAALRAAQALGFDEEDDANVANEAPNVNAGDVSGSSCGFGCPDHVCVAA